MVIAIDKKKAVDTLIGVLSDEVGVHEVGNSNTGKRVQEYQAATTLGGTGWPWCAALLAWGFQQSVHQLGAPIEWDNTASTDALYQWAKAKGILKTIPQRGDVFLVRAKVGDGYATNDMVHTGLVKELAEDSFTSIEGNSNNDGSSNGDGVYSNKRVLSQRYYYIRWTDLFKGTIDTPNLFTIKVKGAVVKGVAIENTNYVSVRDFATALGKPVSWDGTNSVASIEGTEVPSAVKLIDSKAYYPLRVLAAMFKLTVEVDGSNVTVK